MMQKGFILIICLLLATSHSFSQQQPSKEELQKQQKQLQKEIDDLNNSLVSNRQNQKQYLRQLAIVQRKVALREQLISSINKDLRRIDDEMYSKEIEINHLKKELDTLKQNYAKSIVFAYKNRSSYAYLNFLFSSDNFNDALKRVAYLKSYRQYRETEAAAIVKTQDILQQNITSLNSSKTEKTSTLKTQSSQLKVLEEDKKEKDQVVKQLKDQEKDIQAQLKKREKERQQLNKALEAAIKRAQQEAIAKQKALEEQRKKLPVNNAANETAKNNPTVKSPKTNEPLTGMVTAKDNSSRDYSVFESTPEGRELSINFENNRGRLPWPVSGGVVTDHFGKQNVTGTKLTELNDGIFIGTQIGTTVKCVADGEVTMIYDLNDYQGVLVQHGKYFTVYNKLSDVNVTKGQTVKAGTLIGKAAEDFDGSGKIEFRVMNEKGKFIDPEKWLKSR